MSDEAVCDAHHHIWRQADLPWLQGEMQPRIFGPYRPLMRDYPIEEFAAEARAAGVTRSVYVQTNWPPGRAVAEARWVAGEAARGGLMQGIVGFADFAAPDLPETLAALAVIPGMRGIRQQLHWHANPQYRFAPHPDVMSDPGWRAGFARLGPTGLLFELQVFAGQMAAAERLIADFPDQVFVLEHAGMPEDRGDAGWAAWRAGMAALARRPNLHVKLSGLGTFVHAADAGLWRPVVQETIALFGPSRCLFGSNFPIEKLWTSYADLLAAFRACIADLSPEERRGVLHDNAVRLYRLD